MEWNQVTPGYRMQNLLTGEPFKYAGACDEWIIADDGREYRRDECRPIGGMGFIPFANFANTTDEGRELLAEIRADEMEWADLHSRVLFFRKVDELDLIRLRRVVSDAKCLRRERERRANPTPGHCWQCGNSTGGTSIECRPCHEGMTPHAYGRAMSKIFLTEPQPLPSWMR